MIYIHREDGSVENKYSSLSGIEYVIEYAIDWKYDNMDLIKIPKKFIHVACRNWKYADNWINRHETLEKVRHEGFLSWLEPVWCVNTAEGTFSYWYRNSIKIDWNFDYHFYPNNKYEKL